MNLLIVPVLLQIIRIVNSTEVVDLLKSEQLLNSEFRKETDITC